MSSDLLTRFLKRTSAYSVREAGSFIGVSGERVSNWRNGDLPKRGLNRRVERAIEEFLAQPEPGVDMGRVEQMALTLAAARLEQLAADLRKEAKGTAPPPHELTTQVKRAASAVKSARQGKGQKPGDRKAE